MTNNKEEFLRKFNDAFLKPDLPFIFDSVTDDVEWVMVGDQTVKGKKDLQKFFDNMDDNSPGLKNFEIENIITHGKNASVNGTMKMDNQGKEETYGYCDVYEFSGFKNPRIKSIHSYVIAIKN